VPPLKNGSAISSTSAIVAISGRRIVLTRILLCSGGGEPKAIAANGRRVTWTTKLAKGHEKREKLSWFSRAFVLFVIQTL